MKKFQIISTVVDFLQEIKEERKMNTKEQKSYKPEKDLCVNPLQHSHL
jgi:hypothetical protein